MKTALQLMMRDPRTGTVAQAIIRTEVSWQFIHSAGNPDMNQFRPIELVDLTIASDDYTTRYVPYPAPRQGLVDRIVAWLRERVDQMRAA